MTNLVFLQDAAAASQDIGVSDSVKKKMSSIFGRIVDKLGTTTDRQGMVRSWIMMILIFVVFYFFMIRPQTKKQKELQKQREAMKKGDKVITAGGIHGVIKEVSETTMLIEVAKDVVIKVDKASVYVDAEDAQADASKK